MIAEIDQRIRELESRERFRRDLRAVMRDVSPANLFDAVRILNDALTYALQDTTDNTKSFLEAAKLKMSQAEDSLYGWIEEKDSHSKALQSQVLR